MKYGKKLLAVLLAALMLLSLSACGLSDIPVIKAAAKFGGLTSFHAEPDLELGMQIQVPAYGMTMDVVVTGGGQIDYSANPLGFSADVQLVVFDEATQVLAYGADVDGDFVVEYSLDGGATWESEVLGETADITAAMGQFSSLGLSDLIDLGKELGEIVSGFTKGETEQVNGAPATRYDAAISLSALADDKEAMEEFFSGMSGSTEIDAAALAEMIDFSTLADMRLSVWLDEASDYIVKAELDMTDMMRSLFASGLLDALLAEEAGLEGMEFSLDLSAMRLAVTFSQFDSVGAITRPAGSGVIGGADGPTGLYVTDGSALSVGSYWYGSIEVKNHAGQGVLENGSYEVWGILDTAGDDLFFELYDNPEFAEDSTPYLSYWARLEGDSIVPVIGEDDAWLFEIYLTEDDTDALTFTLRDGVLTAEYFYYDSFGPEACDISFVLVPDM